jgi:Hydrogenase/urease nickel incorporation, metallochaperone, hypA
MHEMGIAASILDAVEKELLQYPGYRAAKVTVRIGEFAGVDGESVRFCFDVMVKDSPLAPLELDVVACGGDELDLGSIELDELETRVPEEVPHDTGPYRTESAQRE